MAVYPYQHLMFLNTKCEINHLFDTRMAIRISNRPRARKRKRKQRVAPPLDPEVQGNEGGTEMGPEVTTRKHKPGVVANVVIYILAWLLTIIVILWLLWAVVYVASSLFASAWLICMHLAAAWSKIDFN